MILSHFIKSNRELCPCCTIPPELERRKKNLLKGSHSAFSLMSGGRNPCHIQGHLSVPCGMFHCPIWYFHALGMGSPWLVLTPWSLCPLPVLGLQLGGIVAGENGESQT